MVEFICKSEVSERGGEGVYSVIKTVTKSKVSKGRWEKVVNRNIKSMYYAE